jgi:phosphoglycolate phosphatase-like HAD superfamily hydrolase
MKCPDIMITDDDIRTNKYGPRTLLVKPNPQLILLAHKQWEYARDLSSDVVIYTGDDLEKDGKMAENAGIPFIHFDEENTKHTHWHRLHSDLLCGKPPFQNFG